MCLVHGVHVAANKMSYGSFFIFLGCFQHVTTSVMLLILRKELMHDMLGDCLKDLKAPNQDLEETCKRLKEQNKKVRMNSLLNPFEDGKTEDNMHSY